MTLLDFIVRAVLLPVIAGFVLGFVLSTLLRTKDDHRD